MASNDERPAPKIDYVREAMREHDADNAPVLPHRGQDAPGEPPEEEGSDSGDVAEHPGRL